MSRLAPADSWFVYASNLKTDMLLAYVFAGTPADPVQAAREVMRRARECPELRLRVSDSAFGHGHPRWVSGDVEAHQIVVHAAGRADWSECLRQMCEVIDGGQLDTRRAVWRLHVFPGVHGAPGTTGESTVTVLQMSHAFADGGRSSILAGVLFGRTGVVVPEVAEHRSSYLPGRVLTHNAQLAVWRRRLARATEMGTMPPAPCPVPALSINGEPEGATVLRTLVLQRPEMPSYSVTIGALVAVSEALSGYLEARGEDASMLTALVPMAQPGLDRSRNRWVAEFVRLYPDVRSRDERAALIADGLEQCRIRRRHPAFVAEARALAALPAPVLRWVTNRPPPKSRNGLANTSLSSVYRGAADLTFGECPVVMTAGYPFLSPFLGLAHGVHRIGDTVAVSIHTAESVMADVDEYMDRLETALRA